MASVNNTRAEREMFSGWERERKGERGDGEVHDSTHTFPQTLLHYVVSLPDALMCLVKFYKWASCGGKVWGQN